MDPSLVSFNFSVDAPPLVISSVSLY